MNVQSGIASDGDVVIIPGEFEETPHLILTPRFVASGLAVATYDGLTIVQCKPDNLQPVSPGSKQYQFTAQCRMILGNAYGILGGLPIQNTNPANNSFNISGITSAPNLNKVAFGLKVGSVRGTDEEDGLRYVRKVTVSLWGKETASADPLVKFNEQDAIIYLEDDLIDLHLEGVPTSAVGWTWEVRFLAEDYIPPGSVSPVATGEIEYFYSQDSVVSNNHPSDFGILKTNIPKGYSETWDGVDIRFPILSSSNVYKIEYNFSSISLSAAVSNPGNLNGIFQIYHEAIGAVIWTNGAIAYSAVDGITKILTEYKVEVTLPGANPEYDITSCQFQMAYNNGSEGASLGFELSNPITCTVFRREPGIHSTTPVNTFILEFGEMVLNGPISPGNCSWLAMGE